MLEIKHVSKRYGYQKVLDDIQMILPDIGMIAIIGPSGCGKSTLLHIIGGIDKKFQGNLYYNERPIKKRLARYRKKHVNFIFQQLHFIQWLSVQQNMHITDFFNRHQTQNPKIETKQWNKMKIGSLSLGQRQRVAYLRACHQMKDILLCDEPTGSLDPVHAKQLMQYLKEESQQKLVVLVSHDLSLVQQYCDEIYEMKDGRIMNHQIFHQPLSKMSHGYMQKRIFCPHFQLACFSFRYFRRRMSQLIIGLVISLICILITLTMSQSLENQIYQYIYSLVPPLSISIKGSQNNPLTQKSVQSLKEHKDIERVQLFMDEYELLGIGFKGDRYKESETLFIGDDTSPYQHLLLAYGRFPEKNHEIMVSLSTAQHLCLNQNVEQLIGKKIFAWYKKKNQVRAIEYHVVGITNNKTSMDTLYQRENAYIELLKKRDQFNNVHCQLGIIFLNQDSERSGIVKDLEHQFPMYQFVETGASTIQHVSSVMNQIEMVLYLFSSLAILSSLFLIGEVMFLNVIQKTKDFAIMICFGATKWDFLLYVVCETLMITGISMMIVSITYKYLIQIINQFFQELLVNETIVLSFQYQLLLQIGFLAFILVIISQIAPMIYMMKLNVVEALKNS